MWWHIATRSTRKTVYRHIQECAHSYAWCYLKDVRLCWNPSLTAIANHLRAIPISMVVGAVMVDQELPGHDHPHEIVALCDVLQERRLQGQDIPVLYLGYFTHARQLHFLQMLHSLPAALRPQCRHIYTGVPPNVWMKELLAFLDNTQAQSGHPS